MTVPNLPVMDKVRLDYPHGTYDPKISFSSVPGQLIVRHEVTGENLVTDLLEQSKAVFVSEIAAPYSTFRRVLKCESGSGTSVRQPVDWNEHEVVPPVYIRPLVVANIRKPTIIDLNSATHGVHEIWNGLQVELKPGAILASEPFSTPSSMVSLIRILKDNSGELKEGSYRVRDVTAEGFYFEVAMHPNLFDAVSNSGLQRKHANTILTGALATGLDILKCEYYEEKRWSQYPILRVLDDELKMRDLPSWGDENFRADEVATQLKPIEFRGYLEDD